jgi:hypothetical protein
MIVAALSFAAGLVLGVALGACGLALWWMRDPM